MEKSSLIYCQLNILGFIIRLKNFKYRWMNRYVRWLKYQKSLNINSLRIIDIINIFIGNFNGSTLQVSTTNPNRFIAHSASRKYVTLDRYLAPDQDRRQVPCHHGSGLRDLRSLHFLAQMKPKNEHPSGAHFFSSSSDLDEFSSASRALFAAELPRFLALRYHSLAFLRSFSMPMPSS